MNRLIRSLLHVSCLGLTLGTPLALSAAEPATRPAADVEAPAAKPEGPATKPAEPKAEKPKLSEQFLLGQRNQRDNSRSSNLTARDLPELNLSDFIQFSLERGMLKADIQVPGSGTSQRFKTKGSSAVWTASRSTFAQQQWVNNAIVRNSISTTSIDRVETEALGDADVWTTHLSVSGSSFSIRGQSVLGYIYFSQSNRQFVRPGVAAAPAVSLMVQEWAAMNNNGGIRMNTAFRATANSIAELRARNPEGFRKYLLPLLAKFSDLNWMTPGATDVYAVFSEIPAAPQAVATVDALLPELDSDVFTARDAAGKQLLELGPPAVLAVLRKDLTQLSDEQRAQIGRLIAAHRRRGDLSPAEARKDPAFLADCLEHSDPAVRTAAKAALEKVLGQSLGFDPKLSPEQSGAAVDEVRKKVSEMQAAAATQPAEGENGAAAPAPAVGPAIQLQQKIFVR